MIRTPQLATKKNNLNLSVLVFGEAVYMVLRQRDVLSFIQHSLGLIKKKIISIIESSGS